MGEIWKPVPSEPGVLASTLGRILLAPRYAPLPNGGFRLYQPEPRYGQIGREHPLAAHSYRIIRVYRKGKGKRQFTRKVHQLICEAFHGAKPFEKAVVIHIDEDAHNNRPENLRWGTQKENLNAPGYRASTLAAPLDIECANCGVEFRRRAPVQKFCSISCCGSKKRKLSDAQQLEIKEMLRSGVFQKEIAKKFGVSQSAIFRINAKMNSAEVLI